MPIAAQSQRDSLAAKDGRTIRRYGLEKNFKGFSYSRPENLAELQIRLLPDLPQSRKLAGVWIKANDDGEIQEMGPVFDINNEVFDVTVWALNAFSSKRLSFDGLWEVFRAATVMDVSDGTLFRFLLETVSGLDDPPNLANVKLTPGMRCWSALRAAFPDINDDVSLQELEKMNGAGP